MKHRPARTGMARGLSMWWARGWQAGRARTMPLGRASGLLAGAVLLVCAAFIDPPSFLRTDTETQASSYREFRSAWTAWTAWLWTDSFVPGVARADHADPPQRGDDHPKSIIIDDFDNADLGGFPQAWKAWRGDDDLARNLYSPRG